jgi:Holliday junction DNA helicase RuvB
VIDKGPYAKTIKFNLKHFTLIGATTRAGLLAAPMRGRFGLFYHMDFYEAQDLVKILKRSAQILKIKLDADSMLEIARRSRGTPRIANRLLRRVRDWAEVKSGGKISKEAVDKALIAQGIDRNGLDNLDRKVLQAIIDVFKGGPVGIDAIAATLNEERDTIADIVEPYLLKNGFLKRTPRGRQATNLAYQSLSMPGGREVQKEMFK